MGRESGPSPEEMGLTEKDTKMGEFDPKNYKSYAELPEEYKPFFVELDGGAFVRRTDDVSRKFFEKRVGRHVAEINTKLEKERSLWDKIRRREPEGKVSTMDFTQEIAKDIDKHRVQYAFLEEFIYPFNDKYIILSQAEDSFKGMTKEKLDARMEEVYQEMHHNDPSVDRDKLFRELRQGVLSQADRVLNAGNYRFYEGMDKEIIEIANTMKSVAGGRQ